MPSDLPALQEQIDIQKRTLELQLMVLNRPEFIRSALEAYLSDEPGKDWDELKEEMGLEL